MIIIHPNLQEVEQASALRRRFHHIIREAMRAMAARICCAANWEAKKIAGPLHLTES